MTSTTLLDALRPTLSTFRLLSLHPGTTSRGLILYSLLSIGFFTAAFIHGLLNTSIHAHSERLNEIASTVDFVQLVGVRVTHVVILVEALTTRRTFLRFIVGLSELDARMERQLQFRIDHAATRQRSLRRVIGMTVFYVGVQLTLLATIWFRGEFTFLAYWASYVVPFFVTSLRYVECFVFVTLLRERLALINHRLREIHAVGDAAAGRMRRDRVARIQLDAVRGVYDQLWELSNLFNRCFGLSMLFSVGNDFVGIVGHCYWIFLSVKDGPLNLCDQVAVIGSVIWTVPSFINTFTLAALCHETVDEANETPLLVHKIEFDLWNENNNALVEQFSLQLLHQKIAFSAAGFFDVDYSLLFMIVGSTTTYLVILIQFHMTEELEAIPGTNKISTTVPSITTSKPKIKPTKA